MKKIVCDLDQTLTVPRGDDYSKHLPNFEIIERLRQYKNQGFSIIIYTARNMRTYQGQIGKINVHTLPGIIDWLDCHQVPYDEIIVGKPWCGSDGFYVDDRAVRPSEFCSLSFDQLNELLEKECL